MLKEQGFSISKEEETRETSVIYTPIESFPASASSFCYENPSYSSRGDMKEGSEHLV